MLAISVKQAAVSGWLWYSSTPSLKRPVVVLNLESADERDVWPFGLAAVEGLQQWRDWTGQPVTTWPFGHKRDRLMPASHNQPSSELNFYN